MWGLLRVFSKSPSVYQTLELEAKYTIGSDLVVMAIAVVSEVRLCALRYAQPCS